MILSDHQRLFQLQKTSAEQESTVNYTKVIKTIISYTAHKMQ